MKMGNILSVLFISSLVFPLNMYGGIYASGKIRKADKPKSNSESENTCLNKYDKSKVSSHLCGANLKSETAEYLAQKKREQEEKLKASAKANAPSPATSPRKAKPKSVATKPEPVQQEKPNPIAAKETNVTSPTGDSPLEVCIKDFEQKAKSCTDDASEAKTKCDIKLADDDDLIAVQKMAGKISNGVTGNAIKYMADTDTGNADQCAQIALLGNTATIAMNAFKTNCDDIYSKCIDTCKTVRESIEDGSVFNKCKSTISSATEKINDIPAEEYLTEQIERVKNIYNDGDSICYEATKEYNIAKDLMNSLGKSTQAAKTCQCQLSAAGQQGATGAGFDPSQCAQNVPNPADCLPGASLAGSPACNIYANDDCTLGSGKYNSTPCQCARDNSASACRTVAGKPAPSNFALDLKSNPGGVSVGAGGLDGGADMSGNLNLDGGYDIKKPAVDSKLSDVSGAGGGYSSGSGGAGGGGGGSAGGGSNEDPGALGDGEDGSGKSGLAGLFNQVKSSVGDMFGSKNKTGKTNGSSGSDNSNRGPKYNVKDWIPRGVAGTGCQISQMRCKNEDIFSIMNHRYDNNEMTFIQSP